VLARQPGIARDLEVAYDAWWGSVQPDFVNENAVGPAVNPFKEQYARQFPNP
jgi:hypothetical protein